MLSKEKVIEKIDYYSEVLLYISMNRATTEVSVTFTDGAKVEVKSNFPSKYLVQFIDNETKEIEHHTIISNNMWTKTNIMFYKLRIVVGSARNMQLALFTKMHVELCNQFLTSGEVR